MKFISLDADDVIYQDGASAYLNSAPNAAPETTSAGAQIPNGTVTYNHGYTGDLKIVPADNSAVPDYGSGTPEPAGYLAGAHAARGAQGRRRRHDRRVHASVRDVDLGPRQWL